MESETTIQKQSMDTGKPKGKNSYAKLLEPYGCPCTEHPPFLHIGNIQHHKRWLIYISCNVFQMDGLLQRIMPLLAEHQVPFRIPIGKNELNEINAGEYGYYLTGCAVTVYPRTKEEADTIAKALLSLSQGIRGIAVPNSIHLGNTIYTNYSHVTAKGKKKGMVKFRLPKQDPFTLPVTYPAKRPRLLAGRYVPVYIYSNRSKGDIFKSVDVKRFAFKWCFIKQGRAEATLDKQGRAMKERLLWQKEVLRHLDGWVHAPRFLDYFEKGKDAYLVTELAEGETLFHWVKKTLGKIPFREQNVVQQFDILELFNDIVKVIGELHNLGYVHRDITDTNFIITRTRDIKLVDFELAYSLTEERPNPPFCYGTPGYLSPEQAKGCKPTEKEDVYSLGGLLLFMLTGERPESFIEQHGENAFTTLNELTGSESYGELIRACRNKDAALRPSIEDIKYSALQLACDATDYLSELTKAY